MRRRLAATLAAATLALTPIVVGAPAASETDGADAAAYGQVWNRGKVTFRVPHPTNGNINIPPGYNSRYMGVPDANFVLPVKWADGSRSCILYRWHNTSNRWSLNSTVPGQALYLPGSPNWDVKIVMTQGSRCYLS